MNNARDLALIIRSRFPLVVVERKLDPQVFDVPRLAALTDGYSGSSRMGARADRGSQLKGK